MHLLKKPFTYAIMLISIGLGMGCGGGHAIMVSADTVAVRDIFETVSASGKINPELEVKVSSDVSGEIVELHVAEGDSVKKGDLLMVINPDLYQSEFERNEALLQQTQANLASAKARFSQAKAQFIQAEAAFKRNQSLFQKEAISRMEFEQSETQYLVAQSEMEASKQSIAAAEFTVESTRAALTAARKNLARTRILAPMSGIVSKLAVEQGERVVGTAQMTGTEMLRIANLANMEVTVEVNENDIVKLHLMDTAFIEVDAYNNRKFTGVVTAIANSPKSGQVQMSTDEVTNFEVKIRILASSYEDLLAEDPKKTSPFRPGMSATVDIRTRRAMGAISVPIGAVTARKDTANPSAPLKEYVFLVDGEVAKQVEVTTGLQDSRFIELLSGVEAGQVIVDGPYAEVSRNLKDGTQIRVVAKDMLYRQMGSQEP